MKLNITRQYNKSFVEDTCNLGTSMLNSAATHLFIASNSWDEIYIELTNDVKVGMLKYIPMVCDKIKISLPEDINHTVVHLLTELYPDKAGKIRMAYMQQRDLREELGECLVQ